MTQRILVFITAVAFLALQSLFGAAFANATITSNVISTATYPLAIDIDSDGNVWIGYADGPMTPKGVTVIPASSGTLFGTPVTAGVETRIFDVDGVQGVFRSLAGHLFVATESGALYVATSSPTTVFGTSTTANALTLLDSGGPFRSGLAMDADGNLFGGGKDWNGVAVLPVSTGTLFGVSVTANTPQTLVSSPEWTGDVAVDSSGNLFIGSWFGGSQGVHVLPKATGTLYGQAVSANVAQLLVGTTYVAGIDIDAADNLFLSRWSQNQISVLTPATRTVLGQSFIANTLAVLVDATGDQGLAVASDGSSIVSGGAATVRIRALSDSGSNSSSPPPRTFDVMLESASGSRCSISQVSGEDGAWVTLPANGDCTPPTSKPNAKLLGWATSPDFPVAIALRQVTNGWGAYETFSADGQRTGVFIPAGGKTMMTSAGNLHAVWSL